MKKETPDFITAIVTISLMVSLSFLASFTAEKFTVISSDVVSSFVWSVSSTILTLSILLYYVFTRFRKYVLYLLRKPSVTFSYIFYAYLLFLPCLFLITFVSFVFFRSIGLNPAPQQVIFFYLKSDSFYILFTLFFLSSIVAPFAEEIIFRGIIYPSLKEKFPVPSAIFLSSAIFALMHNEVFVVAGLFAFGILLAYLFEKHQNLWLPIGVHFLNNLFANVAILVVKYTEVMKALEV
jgi:membrane protease YdiL (CAAX protease family)